MNIKRIGHYYKTISSLEKAAWVIFGLSFMIAIYVNATTNRLYRDDVREFLTPIYQLLLLIQLISVSSILIFDFKQKRGLRGLQFIGLSIALMACIVELFDFAPCFFKHTSSLSDHAHPHTLGYTLKRSFLCPSYSHPSRISLILLVGLGLGLTAVTYFAEKMKKPKVK